MGSDELHGAMFRAGIDDVAIKTLDEALAEGATEAMVPVKIAAYGVKDTGKPVGVKERQILDDGCFRGFCDTYPEADPLPMYLDHGHAPLQQGWPSSTLIIGRGDAFRESQEHQGLVVDAVYNLRKEVARDAASEIVFNPRGQRYSFRWDDHKTYRGSDGVEHVSEIPAISEFSQMGFGSAQRDTGPVGAMQYRSTVPAHSTGTTDEDWDADTMLARLSNEADPAMYRRMFAYIDPDADPETKGSYRYAHHEVDEGSVAHANLRACAAAIDALNGEDAANLTPSERRGVYNHLASHLRDASKDVADLKARMPGADELTEWAADEAFRSVFLDVVRNSDPLVAAIREDETLKARMLEEIEHVELDEARSVDPSDYFDRFASRQAERETEKWSERAGR